MYHKGGDTFISQLSDWGVIITWTVTNTGFVEEWEKPIFEEEVAAWFIARNPPENTVTLTYIENYAENEHIVFVTIADPNLAMEFKLRWCSPNQGNR